MRQFLLVITLFVGLAASAQVPPKPDPPRAVNDFAGILTPEQTQELEDTLRAFYRGSTNQIVVVTMSSFDGMDRAQMATKIGQEWGVGDAEKDNGVVILVKPKTEKENGEIFIAPGIGLEGVMPDGVCSTIIRNEAIPHFKQNDYYGGIRSVCLKTMEISSGEFAYTPEELNSDEPDDTAGAIAMIYTFLFIGGIGAAMYNGQRNKERKWRTDAIFFGTGRTSPPPLPPGVDRTHYHSGSSSSSDYDYDDDDYDSGSSSSDSDDYDYGGGSFSGGGAGGSW